MTNQQAPEIYALHTVPNKGERPWSGIYAVRADAEHDAKVLRDATGRDWSVVRLVVADIAATPTGPMTEHDWRHSASYGGELCATCGAVKGTRRGRASCGTAQQPATHVQKPAESEHVAGDAPKTGPKSNMAQQPAPSAACPVGNSGFDHQTAADVLNGKTVSDEVMRKFVAASRWAHDDRAGLQATLLSVRGELASREAEIALLKKALMDAEAPQPAPSAAAASKAVLAAIRAANMQLVRTGDDEFMLVTYKNAKAQCDGGKCGIGGYCDDCPTPQADSQPAMTPETVYAAIAHGDEEHRAWLLSALRAVWCGEAVPPVASPIANAAAESQPAPVLDYPPLPEQVAWRDSVEHCDLYWRPAVQEQNDLEPLFTKQQMRAYVDADRAARAPADSVTAPAGGAVAGSGWKWVPKILSDEMVDAWASARLPGGISQMTDNEANRAVAQANWDAMIAAAPTPPTQAADSVTAPAGGGAVVEWHAPGLGEVHNESHGQLIFCTDGDDVADDTLARRVCAALNATPPTQAQAGAVPLTEDQRSDIATAAARFNWTDDYVEAIDCVIDGVERHHGIKGGQHG